MIDDDYRAFCSAKVDFSYVAGFPCDLDEIHPILFPHQRAIVKWAVEGGRRAVFAAFGLGKTVLALETVRLTLAKSGAKRGLIICPLGVRQEFRRDAAMIGIGVTFIRRTEEVDADDDGRIYLSNYESVRDGRLDQSLFDVVSLDEAACLRSYGSKTFIEFLAKFHDTPHKFVATATPSPNRSKELIHYGGFLGILDTGSALTRYFQRDSQQANNLTLYPHKEREFYLWLASWAVFVQRPSDLGFSDDGYVLPDIDVVWHELEVDPLKNMGVDRRSGQGVMFRDGALGVTGAAVEKRNSLAARVDRMMEIVTKELTEGEGDGGEDGRAAETQGTQRGDGRGVQGEAEGAVSGERFTPSAEQEGAAPEGLVRHHDRGVRGDEGSAALRVCDMSDRATGGEGVRRGSLPQVGCGSGAALQSVQCGDRATEGRSSDTSRSGRVSQLVIWCHLNDEQRAVEKALGVAGISFSSVCGSLSTDECEKRIEAWRDRETAVLVAKPVQFGSGLNLQQCHRAIYLGINFSFAEWIQSVHRIQRFGQRHPVRVDIIHTENERSVKEVVLKKWTQHKELTGTMSQIIRDFGLAHIRPEDVGGLVDGVTRVAVSGDTWTMVNNDTVLECATIEEGSIDLILTSIPFGNQYGYVNSTADFGHNDNNGEFWKQMDYLTPNLLRILAPGRIYACHVKDRIMFGNVTGEGAPTVAPFHAEAILHGIKHGLLFMGMITVVTDVVRENNQTYRLSWSEHAKDATKMGVGCPEYILLFRRPQTDKSRGYADVPVLRPKSDYSIARWQVDAHANWRSGGDRLMSAEEMKAISTARRMKAFQRWTETDIYDYSAHVELGEALDADGGQLSKEFMMLMPASNHPHVWTDINRMITLNSQQWSRDLEMHVCIARGSRVLTQGDGYKPIEQVNVGEMVLTHEGRWRRVTVARMTGVRPVVSMEAQGVSGLIVTPEHEIWTRLGSGAHHKRGAMKAEPGWVRADETESHYVNMKLPPVEASDFSSSEWAIVGRWLADGHVDKRGQAHISCGDDKLAGLVALLGEHCGPQRQVRTGWQVAVADPGGRLRRMFKACGSGEKHIPAEAFALDAGLAKALLHGYLGGDGHQPPSRPNLWMASSISKDLLMGMAVLVQRAHGTIASIYPGRPERMSTIEGRTVHCCQEWVMTFPVERVADGPRVQYGFGFVADDGAWKRVRKVTALPDEVETWCLRVEEDESFHAEGCIVKNCPLQTDIVDRLINQFSNAGELVFDPFAGLGTVPSRAIALGRRGAGVELNEGYFRDALRYCRLAEAKAAVPSLFDALDAMAIAELEDEVSA